MINPAPRWSHALVLAAAMIAIGGPNASAHYDGTCHQHGDSTCDDYSRPSYVKPVTYFNYTRFRREKHRGASTGSQMAGAKALKRRNVGRIKRRLR